MLSAPRRGEAVPNSSGKLALFHNQAYDFEEEGWDETWELLDIATGNTSVTKLNASEISEIVWLPGSETGIIYINGTNEETEGGVSLWESDVLKPEVRYVRSQRSELPVFVVAPIKCPPSSFRAALIVFLF